MIAADLIQEEFERFHEAHPWVYDQFVRIALELRSLGHERHSADGILHIIRWERRRMTPALRLNNDFSRCYSRKAMAENPELLGFFETRELRGLRSVAEIIDEAGGLGGLFNLEVVS